MTKINHVSVVKQPFKYLQSDTQSVLVLLLFCFAIENTVKQQFSCLQYDSQTVLVLLLFCFAIENTVKQPFSCLKETELCIFCMETKKILLHLFWNCNLVNTFCFLLKTC